MRRAWPIAVAALALACGGADRDGLLRDVGVVLAGHEEVEKTSDGEVLPLFFGERPAASLCLTAPPAADTTQWELRSWIEGDDDGGAFRAPDTTLGNTLCFVHPLPTEPAGPARLCFELTDRFDGASARGDCLPLRRRPEHVAHVETMAAFRALMGRRAELDSAETVERLEVLADEADARGVPVAALRLRLVAAFTLRRVGSEAALARARELLEAAPSWLEAPAASRWAAMLSYERGTLALDTGNLQRAWERLDDAEDRYRSTADAALLPAVMKQAEVLARTGALGEGRRRLSAELDRCADGTCEERFVAAARNTLAWLTLQDPDATAPDLRAVERLLVENVERIDGEADPVELANALVNLAYAEARLSEPPFDTLRRAREALRRARRTESERASWLAPWGDVVEALHALSSGDTATAREACGRALTASDEPRVLAWSFGCLARAARGDGDLEAADLAITRALQLHDATVDGDLAQDIPLGPSAVAEDTYEAVRIAVDRGDAAKAWRLLARLDRPAPASDPSCPPPVVDVALHERLLSALDRLDGPASAELRGRRDDIRRDLRERAQEALRSSPACAPSAPAVAETAVDYRAVHVDDEVLLLRRPAPGRFELLRRTPMSRERLLALADGFERALLERTIAPAEWNALAREAATAIVPDVGGTKSSVTFALHGPLQRIPLAALPAGAEGAPLAERTAVAYRPAGTPAVVSVPAGEGRVPLFVVDPLRNLRSGRALVSAYRETFPDATILFGEEATSDSVAPALGRARMLHVDTHAAYDPAFPELSRIALADRQVSTSWLREVAPSLELANLSACGAGRWPVTAGAGRFGMAGLLARLGTRWVIAARADLDDALAADFNTAFYRALRDGDGVPRAYRQALAAVRGRYPVVEWASILLLQGPDAIPPGQKLAARTPTSGGVP